ncbi:unnamed protein product [Macrosiphum euphorbiae]|uniref:HAT C-terminal dimerisation domain-containing protein n=1 Tax=Macrosiphum euphorbiae TaxID=13131 RepID=A0AAV0W6Z0_9HEMI|nr:unnamed protein product [Macrosiphum euphorbiae]
MVKETIINFKDLRTEDNFQKVWERVENISKSNGFREAKLPRLKSGPLKLGGGTNNKSEDLSSEIKILNRLFMNQGCDSIIKRINYVKSKDIQMEFPIYTEILKKFLTIPTNTASCERSFSALRRLKTYLRVTMTQERLSNLVVLYIHNEYKIDFEKIIDRFDVEASIKGRRLALK